jgi:hypothetical protein
MIIKTRACACYDTPDTPLLPGALRRLMWVDDGVSA